MWVCVTCETLNPYTVGICPICGSRKPAPQEQSGWNPNMAGSMTQHQTAPAPQQAVSIQPQTTASRSVSMTTAAPVSQSVTPVSRPMPPTPAAAGSSSSEPSPESEAARKKRKRLRTGLIIANVALLAANVIGIIIVLR
ncbi:MAG: hypothetical protein IKQ39_03885 [Oscillospiraceae bacterium]|nr:hypothetical protein [Oscillospiraceae bacterium]